jgi:tripartite ATP-independent transporter DctM subunit
MQAVVAGAARIAAGGRRALVACVQAVAGAFVIGAIVWLLCWILLEVGASKLIALGVIFVALTLAGNPIVFMLSIVGIISTMDFFGLVFYPDVGQDPLFPFRTTQTSMGLTTGSELIVVLMFLIVANLLNASGLTDRLIRFAASLVGHLRGGMAYVCQVTSAAVSGISGSAQADAAIMTPLLVPAMEKEGYPRDVAAAVVAGASIKGPIGPISIMFIVYGFVSGLVVEEAAAPFNKLLLSGIFAETLLFLFQAATVYLVVRRLGFFKPRPFAGARTVGRTGLSALPVLLIPVIIIGGIVGGIFIVTEAGAVAVVVALLLALFYYSSIAPRDLPRVLTLAGVETGIVLLLVGDSSILATVLQNEGFSESLSEFFTGLTSNKYVFLLLVNLILLGVGIFVEPLPALYILAPILAPVAVINFGIDPVHFGLIMVFNLVLALIHPPIGLVIFLVSSLARVSVERLSLMIIPWLAVSLLVLFLVTYLPSEVVLALTNWLS